jgi:ETFB lysine methyltransferase
LSAWTATLPRPAETAAATEMLTVEVGQTPWRVFRPGNLEELWREMGEEDFGPDERIPYWVELWPSSVLLARWLNDHAEDISGLPCLDVGCGLGLSACVAAAAQARVVGLDYALEALYHATYNAAHNNVPPPGWVQMDWRFPALKKHCFQRIWAADIFYEQRFAEPLVHLFAHALAPEGRIWLAEPERSVSSAAWELLHALGWSMERVCRQKIPTEGFTVDVNMWEVRRG